MRLMARFWLPLMLSLSVFAGCAGLNRYPTGGSLVLAGIDAPVKVVRDDKGMAYIHADTMDDAMRALGYVTAQDRLFQMTLTRLFAEGRICELAGEKARKLDIRHRTLGLHRQAIAHARILAPEPRRLFQNYVDGINAYIRTGQDSFPLEFKLAGLAPEPWSIADSLAILYYMSWDTSANLKTEIVAQMLVERLGEARAREIFPLNINPDDEPPPPAKLSASPTASSNIRTDAALLGFLDAGPLEVGSNNWVAGPRMSAGGMPVVCNDPHLETRILPGPWYPAGLFTPDSRVVGVHIPGLPLMPIFRNRHVAVGITNAYGDMQDLYVETVDPENPGHYLEGDRSIPFTVVRETMRIRDKHAESGFREESLTLRYTRRGPVVSDVLKGLETDTVMSLRWAPLETMAPAIGVTGMISARNVADIRRALARANVIMLNFVFADTDGNIGWHVSGRLPVRSAGDGTVPLAVTDSSDNWRGFVPFEQMPHAYNPDKGWVGTCNHHTVTHDYPYYYSSYQSPSYRYRRLRALMDAPGQKSVDDHWHYQRDTRNLMAEKLVPYIAAVLNGSPETRELAEILDQWDRHDDIDAVGATVFHAVYERFAWLTFADELGDDLAAKMLKVWYFWQERFQQMVLTNALAHWFDDTTTEGRVETRRDILVRAARDAQAGLSASLGSHPDRWQWGNVHRHTFVSPIRRNGFGKGFLGAGTHPASGSVEALYRGRYEYDDPYSVSVSAALRMVADLADEDKVLAVISGGVAGRVFHPHAKDQVAAFMDGRKMYWWFSDREINGHARSVLTLTPRAAAP
ncbi:penicillin amidase [Desulfosarcina alkanivorans]|uniref:Penicillin amidase n=1 Tax=Desulfosarcina alkanivorans TaxID=571177 RepID=A0A5K7YRS3_9BACT|nr:penicillin acylase family protein [Desulfosarcina alkanivorans]BBO67347.1 penicillin amidase [Desulfosarcina alkanivorans]